MRCLIVDDEQLAQEVLEHYIQKLPELSLVGKCSNALQAFAWLNREPVDLMFLDIKMPEMSGLELLRSLKHPPAVILTTAFHEHALDAYELDVKDYLLKPFSFDRFLKALQKVKSASVASVTTEIPEAFYVKSERKLIRLEPASVICVEALKNYLCFHTADKKIMVLQTMTHMEEQLRAYPFMIRVHKSFLLNKHYIREVDNQLIHLSNGMDIPLGASYKDAFLNALKVL